MADDAPRPWIKRGERAVYVGPTRTDLPADQCTILDQRSPTRWRVEFFDPTDPDYSAKMTLDADDLMHEEEWLARAARLSAAQEAPADPDTPDVEAVLNEMGSAPLAGMEVDPFIFRDWLVANTELSTDQVTLTLLAKIFSEFEIFVKED